MIVRIVTLVSGVSLFTIGVTILLSGHDKRQGVLEKLKSIKTNNRNILLG